MSRVENNLTAKIFALIIAIVLWSYVMSVENPVITKEYKNITVNLYNTSALERQGLVVMEPKEVKISVKLRGKKSEIDRFSPSDIIAEADLSGYDEGQVRVPVKVSLLDNFANVSKVDHEPKEILFHLDRVITKEKSVGIQVEGELGEDYVLGDITSKPESVLLRGPKTWINEVAEVKAIVNITGRSSSGNMTVPIQILNDNGEEVRGLDKEPTVVEVNVPILRKHTLPIELQTEGELPEGYEISGIKVNPGSVAVKGENNIINLTHINTKPININELLDKTSVKVELDLPVGVELLNPNEEVTINYVLEEVGSTSYTYDFGELDIRNLNEDLYIEDEDIEDTIQITLRGNKGDLDKITKENIKPYLDFKDQEEGTNEMSIQVESIPGINIEFVVPETLILNLSPRQEEGE